MKRPFSIIWTLIEVNIVVVILSIGFLTATRQQQLQTTEVQQQLISESNSIPSEIKGKIAEYQAQVTEKEEIIQEYEHKLQEATQKIEEYKLQNTSLNQINRLQQNRLSQVLKQPTPQTVTLEVNPTPVYPISLPPIEKTTSPRKPPSSSIVQRTSQKADPPSPESVPANSHPKNPTTTTEIAVHNPIPLSSLLHTIPKGITSKFSITSPQDDPIVYANDIAYGLAIAANQGQINHGTKMYRKVQSAIRILRRGESKEDAIRKADVPETVIEQLLKWGEQRPGRLIARDLEHQP